ncbi:bifunctional purine biosynthesis protein PurH-like [Quillaja saponaria]|uniref:Bifunctional purine biosynthesis protein PurH-like n=1 Tax=Quillaja saponaria TaxID=32244 RepID=A0AAD7VNJ8_QUISA|nr:bifunctional purine biosynthesis protein PurH-like [Quillaja saponaria]
MFYEIVVAPKYTEKGLEILHGKSKTLRILEAWKNMKGKLSLRQVGGGWLVQESDDLTPEDFQFKIPNRVESLRIALRKADDDVKGTTLTSDAFFLFAWKDAVEEACEGGIGVIAEPGGSIKKQ